MLIPSSDLKWLCKEYFLYLLFIRFRYYSTISGIATKSQLLYTKFVNCTEIDRSAVLCHIRPKWIFTSDKNLSIFKTSLVNQTTFNTMIQKMIDYRILTQFINWQKPLQMFSNTSVNFRLSSSIGLFFSTQVSILNHWGSSGSRYLTLASEGRHLNFSSCIFLRSAIPTRSLFFRERHLCKQM